MRRAWRGYEKGPPERALKYFVVFYFPRYCTVFTTYPGFDIVKSPKVTTSNMEN